jgi:hypothetical protein
VTITDALKQARTNHVVYFLLTAYVESLGWYDPPRSRLPARVMRLPVRGVADVIKRLNALRRVLRRHVHDAPTIRSVLEEAVEIFGMASHRLKLLRSVGRASERPERAR